MGEVEIAAKDLSIQGVNEYSGSPRNVEPLQKGTFTLTVDFTANCFVDGIGST